MGMKPKPKNMEDCLHLRATNPKLDLCILYLQKLGDSARGPSTGIVATTSTSAGYRSPNSWRVPKKHRSEHPKKCLHELVHVSDSKITKQYLIGFNPSEKY